MNNGPADLRLTFAVVICAYTHDRWDQVLDAVASAREQSCPPDEIVLVVDHNPDLYRALHTALPEVTVVENHNTRGLSGGKDTGVEVTHSDVIAFLDDDAIAHKDWLARFRGAYTDTDIVGVGGTTLPLWETERPRWFPEEFDWVLGCTFVGREPGDVRNLLGGNASFRREVFSVAGGFPSHIGRTSIQQRPLGCEETEFCIRVRQHRPQWRFVFEPQAVIWHHVPAARERFSYFRSRCYAEGLSKAAVTRSVGIADGLATERSYTARTLTRGILRGVGDALHGDRAGIERSGAISVGLLSAAAGYVRGSSTVNNGVPILMYHAVTDTAVAATRRLSVTPHMLTEHLVYLLEQGYTGITFGELAQSFRAGTPLPSRPVVLTFDDGYADFAAEAWPILCRHSFPATLFVTTGWVYGGPDPAGTPLDRTLDWKQLRGLADSGVEIGAHSHSHPQLDQLSDSALQRELRVSRSLLELHLEGPVTTMSYPFGYSTPRVRAAAAVAGYEHAAVVSNRCSNPSNDRFRLPRMTIRRSTGLAAFAAAVGGSEKPFRADRALTAAMASYRLARRASGRVLRDA